MRCVGRASLVIPLVTIRNHKVCGKPFFITDNARIHVNMAQIYEQQGRRQTALDHYEAAIEIAADNAEAKQGLERLRAS